MVEDDELNRRKHLSFAQAEGAAALPTQLGLGVVSPEMRARLWAVIYGSVDSTVAHATYSRLLGSRWERVLRGYSLDVLHRFVDDFDRNVVPWEKELRGLFEAGDYIMIFEFLQYVVRHRDCPQGLAAQIQSALIQSRSAYRIIEDTVVPVGSQEEAETVRRAFGDLETPGLAGAKVHLSSAAAALTKGQWAESVRESIHAVESVVRVLDGSSSLKDALKRLSNKQHINPNMSAGLERLYNYTSDEAGIRHPLLADGDAKVDEIDALYMFGASAAFLTYLIGKGRAAGLLGTQNDGVKG